MGAQVAYKGLLTWLRGLVYHSLGVQRQGGQYVCCMSPRSRAAFIAGMTFLHFWRTASSSLMYTKDCLNPLPSPWPWPWPVFKSEDWFSLQLVVQSNAPVPAQSPLFWACQSFCTLTSDSAQLLLPDSWIPSITMLFVGTDLPSSPSSAGINGCHR